MREELREKVEAIVDSHAYRIILSKPKKSYAEYIKIVMVMKEDYYQAECYTQKQVFHFNYTKEETVNFCIDKLCEAFGQLNSWSDEYECQISISKKNKVFFNRKQIKQAGAPKKAEGHNRRKNYILNEGEVIPPLVDMGVFTAKGQVVASMYDKFKQINRFLEIIDDAVKNQKYDDSRPLKIVDFGCGKSYLTFVLYYYFTQIKKISVNMIGLDLKEDVIAKCNNAASKYGYENLTFMVGDVGCYTDSVPADMVITLHACDTATDYALFHAIKWNAKMIFSVPCCQHELNQQFTPDEMSIIGRYGIVQERTMALFTDAIRANLLEYCGYKTQLMEFVDFENTPKNLLIRAVNKNNGLGKMQPKAASRSAEKALEEVKDLMDKFSLKPTLYRLLCEEGYISE